MVSDGIGNSVNTGNPILSDNVEAGDSEGTEERVDKVDGDKEGDEEGDEEEGAGEDEDELDKS